MVRWVILLLLLTLIIAKKCPECEKTGLRSKVYEMRSSTTAMWRDAYYDEDGVYQSCDPNWITTEYRCSNGHKWEETARVQEC